MKKYKLGDIADVIGGVAFQPSDIQEEGIRILRGGNIQSQAIVTKENDVFLPLNYTNQDNQLQMGDTILVASSGSVDVLGKAATCFKDYPNTQIGAFLRIIRPKEECYSMLISIALNSPHFARYIKSQAKGTSINNITLTHLKEYEICCPEDFSLISDLYLSIARKIELNRAINHNLEAMAKQLYDYWFVQFDFPNENGKPYKSSGGKMMWNDILTREIPEDWNISELNKWLEIKSGFAFKSDTYVLQGTYKVITIKNVQDHHLETTNCDFVNEIPQGLKDWCRLSVNDRLISLTGNCGRLCIVTEENLLLNQRVGLLSCREENLDYAYFLLSSKEFQTFSNNLAMGAAQANLSPVELCKSMAIIPPKEFLDSFNQCVRPIIEDFIQNEIQITTLIKQRDELLPLLMNGQVKVSVERSRLNYDLSTD